MKTTQKNQNQKKQSTTNLEPIAFYKIYPDNYTLTEAKEFHIQFFEQPIENVIEFEGFLFIVEPSLRTITELRSGAKLDIKRIENNPKEPFSSYVAKVFKWVRDNKNWEDIQMQVSGLSFAYREPHLNLLIF